MRIVNMLSCVQAPLALLVSVSASVINGGVFRRDATTYCQYEHGTTYTEKYPHIHGGYFVASFSYFNGTGSV